MPDITQKYWNTETNAIMALPADRPHRPANAETTIATVTSAISAMSPVMALGC
ncbi:hypothetical protein ROLI_005080 [Roseobacter fucihabitans]|uniref:Uncharacterized protein n=1 Tax=Roseobacter fucihabitans TaxID=1537242 RepID=A0ABZ2BQ28_9RHOB|nr:hypothetical protein [Roseobacter litoralis]MBC6964682.1 hypothetical protein [Roseobacter litoralis]